MNDNSGYLMMIKEVNKNFFFKKPTEIIYFGFLLDVAAF